MIIKRCTVSDADEIYKIEEESFSDPIKKETFKKDLGRDTYYCFGLFESEIEAFVSFEKVLDEGQIISVATGEKWRKMGFASLIFEKIISFARREGISFLTLEVRGDNTPGLALYKKMGFKEVGIRKGYYQNPDCDAILMDLHIGDE